MAGQVAQSRAAMRHVQQQAGLARLMRSIQDLVRLAAEHAVLCKASLRGRQRQPTRAKRL